VAEVADRRAGQADVLGASSPVVGSHPEAGAGPMGRVDEVEYSPIVADGADVERVIADRIGGYARRARVLRQIHSNKGSRAQRWSRWYLVATVVVASVVSVIGFMGIDRLAGSISSVVPVSAGELASIYNLAVLAILVLTILGLIYRFDERSNRHYRSIEVLTEFIRDVDDAVALAGAGGPSLGPADLDRTRLRYVGILASLPPNTDKEYLKAKDSAAKKLSAKNAASDSGLRASRWDDVGSMFEVEPELGAKLAAILLDSPRVEVLSAVREVLGAGAWVTGGFIREAVWDDVHGYAIPTPLEDVDVVYFESDHAEKSDERAKEEALLRRSGNVEWSVKNQARMHAVSKEKPYESIEDAVSRFPETATAVACRLGDDDRVKILAPYGLSDAFALIVRPTPGFKVQRYQERVSKKRWRAKWPNLQILDDRDPVDGLLKQEGAPPGL